MKKQIIAAGAGHGALSAAITLASNGYEVTIYEKCSEKDIGHDWVDSIDITSFDFAGIARPPKYICERPLQMSFTNPSKTVQIVIPERPADGPSIYIDRKGLLKHLISEAKKAGVKFVFRASVCGAVTAGDEVVGIRIDDGSKEKVVFADLVIDSAGVNSPVRRSLPQKFNIVNEISTDDMISTFRAYYDKKDDTMLDPPYAVHLYHMGRPGMDWVMTKDKCVDLFLGKFAPFEEGEIDAALVDFREEYPFIGDELLRGGTVEMIPIRSTLPKIVCNGYAAIGDCAGMTVPLKGSGIDLSLKAGKLLAGAVMATGDKRFSTENLWSYQYRYFTMFGSKLMLINAVRGFLRNLNPAMVDYFLESKLISDKEIEMTGGDVSVTVKYILSKLKTALPKANELLPSLVSALRNGVRRAHAAEEIPVVYTEKAFSEWAEKYEN